MQYSLCTAVGTSAGLIINACQKCPLRALNAISGKALIMNIAVVMMEEHTHTRLLPRIYFGPEGYVTFYVTCRYILISTDM